MRWACILAGGSGERFWPLSRLAIPKHLLRIFGGRTMLENTARRLEGIVPPERILVLTNAAQRASVIRELPFLPEANILAEPARRDTAPACALATALARSRDPEAVCALLPSDAMIHDAGTFRSQLAKIYQAAEQEGAILTFGIRPTYPATGYGYLEFGPQGEDGISEVLRFTEKPDAATAEKWVADGRHAWNAGIFVWQAEVFLREARRQCPQLADFIENFPANSDPAAYLETNFSTLPKISVDYAILEGAQNVRALAAEFDWDDVGSWTSLPRHFPSDASGNTCLGAVTALEARGNIAVSSGRTIALYGVEDLIVVETADAVLVAPKSRAQDIKKLFPSLPEHLK